MQVAETFQTTTVSGQGLLLALCSEISPSGAQRPYQMKEIEPGQSHKSQVP